MAEAAGNQVTPSFKLVLVGDGGTGKVRLLHADSIDSTIRFYGLQDGLQKAEAFLTAPCLQKLFPRFPPFNRRNLRFMAHADLLKCRRPS